jgi:hypothetical protein
MQTPPPNEGDFFDRPMVGRATTQLERSFGPSCLLSLVIVFLLTIVLKLDRARTGDGRHLAARPDAPHSLATRCGRG